MLEKRSLEEFRLTTSNVFVTLTDGVQAQFFGYGQSELAMYTFSCFLFRFNL